MPSLSQILDRAEFVALSLCRVADGWQASLEVERGAFRIRMGATPTEALGALFERAALPPLPY